MKHFLIELFYLAAGLVGAAGIAWLAAWSVPNVRDTIWMVAYVAMLIVAFMAIRPLRLAWRADRQADRGSRADG
ncbi:MAG: hypothetical protein ABI810_09660 [Sphingomonas bacterium]